MRMVYMVKPFRNSFAILLVLVFSILVYSRYSKERKMTQPKTISDETQESLVIKKSTILTALPD